MISLNKAMVIGNLTRDPELRHIPSGQAVSNFSVATNRRWKNQDGTLQDETQYHDIVVWGKLAEVITQILKKGNKVFVEGRLQTRQWDAPDGAKMRRTEIVMENFVPLAPRPAGAPEYSAPASTSTSTPQPTSTAKKDETTNDLPDTPIEDEINLDEIPF